MTSALKAVAFLAMAIMLPLAGTAWAGHTNICFWIGVRPVCHGISDCGPGNELVKRENCAIGLRYLCCEKTGSTTSDSGGSGGGGVDPCYKQCSPMLRSINPLQEAQRVFKNCMALCNHTGTVTCPDGSTRQASNGKC